MTTTQTEPKDGTQRDTRRIAFWELPHIHTFKVLRAMPAAAVDAFCIRAFGEPCPPGRHRWRWIKAALGELDCGQAEALMPLLDRLANRARRQGPPGGNGRGPCQWQRLREILRRSPAKAEAVSLLAGLPVSFSEGMLPSLRKYAAEVYADSHACPDSVGDAKGGGTWRASRGEKTDA